MLCVRVTTRAPLPACSCLICKTFSSVSLFTHYGRPAGGVSHHLKRRSFPLPPPSAAPCHPIIFAYIKRQCYTQQTKLCHWWTCHGSGVQSPVGSAMVRTHSRRIVTAEALFRSRVSPCEICAAQSGTGIGLSPAISIFPVSIIPAMLHTHLPVVG